MAVFGLASIEANGLAERREEAQVQAPPADGRTQKETRGGRVEAEPTCERPGVLSCAGESI